MLTSIWWVLFGGFGGLWFMLYGIDNQLDRLNTLHKDIAELNVPLESINKALENNSKVLDNINDALEHSCSICLQLRSIEKAIEN